MLNLRGITKQPRLILKIFLKFYSMDLNDLWIGDKVKMISSGEIGKFEGVDPSGMANVRIGKELKLAAPSDLMQEEDEDVFIQPKKKVQKGKDFNFEIMEMASFNRKFDLHMESFNDYEPRSWPSGELDFQVYKCRNYLKEAIKNRVPRVEIIHGRGKGILKNEVMNLLFVFDEVKSVNRHEHEGMLEVWFDYV